MATYSADKAIAWGKSQLGTHKYDGYCLRFVAKCYQAATGHYDSKTTATEAYRTWCVSHSNSNVPIGAAVFFNGSRAAIGHVGMYIGNGQYIHAANGVKIANFTSASQKSSYRGWGWLGNRVLSSSSSDTQMTGTTTIANRTTIMGSDSGVQVYHSESPRTIRKWGLLRYFASIDNPSVGPDQVKKMLELYNRKKRTLVIRDAIGDTTIRAGTLLPVQLNVGDQIINNYMLVDKVVHKFSSDNHTMDLTLEGAWEKD